MRVACENICVYVSSHHCQAVCSSILCNPHALRFLRTRIVGSFPKVGSWLHAQTSHQTGDPLSSSCWRRKEELEEQEEEEEEQKQVTPLNEATGFSWGRS